MLYSLFAHSISLLIRVAYFGWASVREAIPSRVCYSVRSMDAEQIVESLKQERSRIDAAINVLNGSTSRGGSVSSGAPRGPRRMSAAARARISAAQKKRWAKVKAKKK